MSRKRGKNMKQNKLMRCASLLLVGVLMSTSSISTTFAKYATHGSAQDNARVAKWGVVVTTEGKLFDKTYLSGTSGAPGKGASDGADNTGLSVESVENVIAPGTKNETGLTFKIEGKPEVDVQVKVSASTTNGDVYLNGTGLPDLTTGDNLSDTFNAEQYMPVKYTLTRNGSAKDEDKNLSLGELIERLNNLSGRYDAGTELSGANGFGTYVITWKWDYDGNDKADTLLGSLASGVSEIQGMTLKEGSQYNLMADLKLDITVTQVD